MNVLGIFFGDIIGSKIISTDGDYLKVTVIALVVIFTLKTLSGKPA